MLLEGTKCMRQIDVRGVNMKDEITVDMRDHVGSMVDYGLLSIPYIMKPFKKKPVIDGQEYEKQVNYYFENGYVDNPKTLFRLSDTAPEYRKVSEDPYHDGCCQTYTYDSAYEPVNPLIREFYHSFENNRTGYLVRWTHGRENNKTILCLHGYMLGDPNQAEKMFNVAKLFNTGLDVALFVSPFHWKRAPESKAQRGMFIQPDNVVMTCEAELQTMSDLSLCLNILKDLNAGDTGLIGASMGGYNASLYSCLKTNVAFSAMMVPALSYSLPFGPEGVKYSFSVSPAFMKKLTTIWNIHSALNFDPVVPKDRMLIIAAKGDKICRFGNVVKLCEKWGWPRHYFLNGGHWYAFDSKMRGKVWYGFLSDMGFI